MLHYLVGSGHHVQLLAVVPQRSTWFLAALLAQARGLVNLESQPATRRRLLAVATVFD